MKTFEPKDYVAGLIIIAMVIFKVSGHDGSLDAIVALMAGYYFGKRETSAVVVDPKDIPATLNKIKE